MADKEAIEKLKQEWMADPCWDLETTEGFDGHREDLAEFASAHKQMLREAADAEFVDRARKLGLADNLLLAEYVFGIEDRLVEAHDLIARLVERIGEEPSGPRI